MGTVVMGKVESGSAKKGQNLLVMPNRTQVSIDQLWSDDFEVTSVSSGENIKVKLKVNNTFSYFFFFGFFIHNWSPNFVFQGIEEEDVSPGFVLCEVSNPIKVGRKFDAQLVILEHKSIICAGYSAVMHIHCAAEEITVSVSVKWIYYFLYGAQKASHRWREVRPHPSLFNYQTKQDPSQSTHRKMSSSFSLTIS